MSGFGLVFGFRLGGDARRERQYHRDPKSLKVAVIWILPFPSSANSFWGAAFVERSPSSAHSQDLKMDILYVSKDVCTSIHNTVYVFLFPPP